MLRIRSVPFSAKKKFKQNSDFTEFMFWNTGFHTNSVRNSICAEFCMYRVPRNTEYHNLLGWNFVFTEFHENVIL